ncbi:MULTISPECIES: DUF3574 domain-containing protein [Streptomyces]|uniref:DUF3574 domain-containing protein n=1 Tax=Streptomyces lasiicapitis TaxID=1923961 RepID=A0ABQ2MEF8_9ACTN|nr:MULTISPECIES: DUF3574 domain-containing protein [Streptomyces]QIB46404.1 DUF3574 domain-containing protein [Streptomyces aureoverticillatus]GGO50278.1 hypothetical protein GCM10012286_50310 [Streptomyces lasiicapitis]
MALTLTLTGPRLALAATAAVLAIGAPTAYAALDSDDTRPAAAAAKAAPPRGEPFIETRLFFGTERPDGGPDVTDKQFMKFIDDEVTPGFSDGLTVQQGRGQWKDSNGKIERERSYELILLYPTAEAKKRDVLIEEIRSDYEKKFAQDSVGRLDDRARVDF